MGYTRHPMSQQVSIRLPGPMLAELDRRAKRRRLPRADVIRDALSTYLELPEGALQRRPVDRIRHLLGAIDGLPDNLASRADDYLEDLGRRR
ncbi:MAG: ribbon-helix-helix protein, CopG family [Deltaproteobacteria bacterium]|nr:MAG: ribbon-helix-helix protein, CopG family [Deltaproteobacteria bacterium]